MKGELEKRPSAVIAVKVMFSAVLLALALIPAGVWWFAFKFLNPVGFWQRLLFLSLSAFLIGFQIVCLIAFCMLMPAVWEE